MQGKHASEEIRYRDRKPVQQPKQKKKRFSKAGLYVTFCLLVIIAVSAYYMYSSFEHNMQPTDVFMVCIYAAMCIEIICITVKSIKDNGYEMNQAQKEDILNIGIEAAKRVFDVTSNSVYFKSGVTGYKSEDTVTASGSDAISSDYSDVSAIESEEGTYAGVYSQGDQS